MEDSKHISYCYLYDITIDKNTTIQITNIVYTTLRLRNFDTNIKTGK